jgi:quinol monooxygenase YgiN
VVASDPQTIVDPARTSHDLGSGPPGGNAMTAFNTVRFRVKPGRDKEFLDAHKKIAADWPGLKHVNMIKTADRNYCIIAEWSDMDALANSRPAMIATLDTFRDTLEDLGGGLGVTDPVSGPVVMELK